MTKSNTYIKSPLNYVGGKFKLLPSIIPLIPTDLNVFYDLFGGGFNVGINVEAERIVYNDINVPVVRLIKHLYEHDTDSMLYMIDDLIELFKLSKENSDGFLRLRNYYNNGNKDPITFYTLICYAFNYQIRFNKQGEYNMPFGKNRSSFNPVLRQKFIDFCNELHTRKIDFCSSDFRQIDLDLLPDNSFVYCNPPYLGSVATYNEQGAWTEADERDLLAILDRLNDKNIRFALSNNFKYNNPYLDSWKKKYNVHYLGAQYKNCNYHKKDKSDDVEVLITNY